MTFATGLAVVTLNIHHRGMRGREVPSLVKKIVLGCLAKIMLIKFQVPDAKFNDIKPVSKNIDLSHYKGREKRERDEIGKIE